MLLSHNELGTWTGGLQPLLSLPKLLEGWIGIVQLSEVMSFFLPCCSLPTQTGPLRQGVLKGKKKNEKKKEKEI